MVRLDVAGNSREALDEPDKRPYYPFFMDGLMPERDSWETDFDIRGGPPDGAARFDLPPLAAVPQA